MRFLFKLYYKLTDKNFEQRLENAKKIKRILRESTKASINHFYDINGEQIRGYDNRIVRTRQVEHPLIAKYK